MTDPDLIYKIWNFEHEISGNVCSNPVPAIKWGYDTYRKVIVYDCSLRDCSAVFSLCLYCKKKWTRFSTPSPSPSGCEPECQCIYKHTHTHAHTHTHTHMYICSLARLINIELQTGNIKPSRPRLFCCLFSLQVNMLSGRQCPKLTS